MDVDDAHCRHKDVKVLLVLGGWGFAEENAYKGNAMLLVTCFYHSTISSGNWIINKTY